MDGWGMMPSSTTANTSAALAVLLSLLAAPVLADGLPLRVDYLDGRLSVEARNVPVVAVLRRMAQKLGFEVLDMGASRAPVEQIAIRDLPLELAVSKLLEQTSYAIQYLPAVADGQRVQRIIVMGNGDANPPDPNETRPVPEVVPVADDERPHGLTPEQAAQWPALAHRVNEVLRNVYGQQPAAPQVVSPTLEEAFSAEQLRAMEVLRDGHLDTPPPVFVSMEPADFFGDQSLDTLEMFQAWPLNAPPSIGNSRSGAP